MADEVIRRAEREARTLGENLNALHMRLRAGQLRTIVIDSCSPMAEIMKPGASAFLWGSEGHVECLPGCAFCEWFKARKAKPGPVGPLSSARRWLKAVRSRRGR